MDDFIVGATIEGFFNGLALQSKNLRIPENFTVHYKSFLADMKKEDFLSLFGAIANRFPNSSPDTPIIQSQIENHARIFHQVLRSHL